MVSSFLRYLQSGRRLSPNTVTAYRRDLDSFLQFLGTSESELRPGDVTHDDVREWIISLSERGLKPSSVNRMISAGNSFYKYLLREGRVEKNPFDKITFLKKPSNLPTYIPEKYMDRIVGELMTETDTPGVFRTRRDALVVLFLYGSGIRLAELIAIDRDHFSRDYTRLLVTGKGDKQRIIPIMPLLRSRIIQYIDLLRRENICTSQEKALFLTEKGERISRSEVYRAVRRQLTLMGVQGKRSPHVLRHTFATHLLNEGADIREIQELLGHASLSATQVYTHNSITKLKEVYDHAHPRSAAQSREGDPKGDPEGDPDKEKR